MSRQLQSFEHRSTAYERPTQDWVCGQAAYGAPCRIGPDRRGRCRATFECSPRKEGDGWICSRPPSAGGRCDGGPLPDGRCARPISRCVPEPSLRKRRGRAVAWLATVTVGLLVLALYGPQRAAILSPGPTTLQHAEVGGCASCHSDFADGPIGWIHAAFGAGSAADDSKQCLACHNLGESALAPHSLPPQRLQARAEAQAAGLGSAIRPISLSLSRSLFGKPGEAAPSLACATCHREHQGKQADLKAMSNGRCQSCHGVQFAAFAAGHPPFDGYPYSRRTRISFDHRSHIQRHFEKAGPEKAPGTCADCHLPAEGGGPMIVEPFEKSCAACHLEEIEGTTLAGAKGIPFLTVPGLDLVELEDRGIAIGAWPELSDRKVTPFLEILLSRDAASRADLAQLRTLDLLDLGDAGEEDIAAVERTAWAVKGLLHDLLTEGLEPVGSGLFEALGREPDKSLLHRLVATLPQDALHAAQGEWFPDLMMEVARHRKGLPMPAPAEPEAPAEAVEPAPPGQPEAATDQEILSDDQEILSDDQEILSDEETESTGGAAGEAAAETVEIAEMVDPESWTAMGGWYRDFYALFYRPTAHADPFMRAWLDLGGAVHDTAAEPLGRAVFEQLADDAAPGKCAKCHSVDQRPDGGLAVNWLPKLPEPGLKPATRFSHETHFSLLDETGCLTCHRLDPEADYQAAFKQRDPARFASSFQPIRIETCARCHTAGEAGDSCLLCHQYHVGRFPSPFVHTRMQNAMDEKEQPEPATAAE